MDVDLVLDALSPLRSPEPEPEEGPEEEHDGGENVSAETHDPDVSAETPPDYGP